METVWVVRELGKTIPRVFLDVRRVKRYLKSSCKPEFRVRQENERLWVLETEAEAPAPSITVMTAYECKVE